MNHPEQGILCFCNRVTFAQVEECIRLGAKNLSEIYDRCGAGTGPCGGSCRGKIVALLKATPKAPPSSSIPDAASSVPIEVIEAISLFNRRYYWETHEVLEGVWMNEHGPARKFYQGLIQAAAALYHVLNSNPKGVIRLAEEAHQKLEAYQPAYMGIPLKALSETLLRYADQSRKIMGQEITGFDYDALPLLKIGEMMDDPPPSQF